MNRLADHLAIRNVPDHLLARGVHTTTTAELQSLTGLEAPAVHEGMARLRAAGKVFSPAKGLYVIIPAQYRSWRSVPAIDFIDPMMQMMGRRYYVAFLSAAELHGAAHQRPQVFQVMVDRHVRDREFGRVRLRFFVSNHVRVAETVSKNSATGAVPVASPAVTALDLADRPQHGGGLSNVATVVSELADGVGLDPAHIVAAAGRYPAATLRRLGWLLEHVGAPVELTLLEQHLANHKPARASVLLDPSGPRAGTGNRRWGLVENVDVEPDL